MKLCYKCHLPVEEAKMISGLHHDCFCQWFSVATPTEFQDVAAQSSSQENFQEKMWHQVNSSFFQGKFRKYSARIDHTHYLLKVEQKEFPELPLVEYLCNQLAELLGLEIPEYYMIRFQNRLDSFVSRNFMANRPGSDLVHIYRYLNQPEDYNCEHLLHIIEKEVGRYNEIRRFVELCLFDALIGNHDRHGRNLGLIKEKNKTSLAPFYDNPCYLAIETEELLAAYHEPRGAIATTETKNPVMKDYVKEWMRLGFKEEIIQFTNRINIQQIGKLISTSFLSKPRKEAIKKLCYRRYKELCDAI